MSNRSAFSLIEVIVAAVLFAVTVTGIFAAVGSLAKHPVNQSAGDTKSVLYGQKFLLSLRSGVLANVWSGGLDANHPLGEGTDNIPLDDEFKGYHGTYTISTDPDGSRKVTLNIIAP